MRWDPAATPSAIRLGLFAVLILSFLPLAFGCAPQPDACAGWAPIRPEAADVDAVSDELALQILQHNEHGARACGWRP